MIKMTFCLHRLPGMSRAEFLDYWLNTHGETVKQHAEVLNIRRYIQQHILEDPINDVIRKSRNTPEPYDGVAEVWYDSMESMLESNKTEAGRAAQRLIREDEARFIDSARSPVLITQEYTMIDS